MGSPEGGVSEEGKPLDVEMSKRGWVPWEDAVGRRTSIGSLEIPPRRKEPVLLEDEAVGRYGIKE